MESGDRGPVAAGNPCRDGRALWRIAKHRVGLHSTIDEPGDVAGQVLSSPAGRGALNRHSIAGAFVNVLQDRVLGSGTVLQSTTFNRAEPPGIFAPKTDAKAIWAMLTASYMNLMLFCIPLGIVSGYLGWNPTLVFVSNFFTLIPLALILGEVTEDLAVRFGETIGGLLNATFGNVVELILSIAALQKGLYTVVATSLIGSILSNLLLVLGMCFLFGGMKHKQQRFNALANKVSSSLLFLACIAIIIPTAAKMFYGGEIITEKTLFNLSHAIAILLIGLYCCYLFFQLRTHVDYFTGEANEDEPALSLAGALGLLGVITVIVAIASEYLTGAIEAVSKSSGLNQAFLGLIVLPIAGNACEHITAVFVAVKNKMDLAIGVALGSSIQIAIFVIPVAVLAGWVMGKPFTLDFDSFAVLMLTVSVILAYFVSSDGSSNWLLGLQLVGTYCLIAFVFLLEKEAPEAAGKAAGAAAPALGGV